MLLIEIMRHGDQITCQTHFNSPMSQFLSLMGQMCFPSCFSKCVLAHGSKQFLESSGQKDSISE